MLVDNLIPRLRKAGLTVHDIRGALPRNGRWLGRPLSAITGIACHWDAEYRPRVYDSLARYQAQARYHINKDWGGGARGDGLMYAIKVDNVGDVFICRDFEDVTWHVGNLNYSYVGVCFDGTTNQQPTKEQIIAKGKLLEVLSYQCPEFPASQADVRGHREVPQNSTACNGSFLPETQNYRANRRVNPDLYAWDYPPQAPAPTPAPPAPPAPAPQPAKPEWEVNNTTYVAPVKMIANQPTYLYRFSDGARISSFPAGKVFEEMLSETTWKGEVYIRTAYSTKGGIWSGIRKATLDVAQKPQEPQPQPEPTPAPEPLPEPSPQPQPPVPPADSLDSRVKALELFSEGVVGFFAAIGRAIAEFVSKFGKKG